MFIFKTNHWLLAHRKDSKLPGYLILASEEKTARVLSDLPKEALGELGIIEAKVSSILEQELGAKLVYIGRWGHQPGYAPHFHIIPLYSEVEKAYQQDSKWVTYEPYPDGAVYCTYIMRTFVESTHPPQVVGFSVQETVRLLKNKMAHFSL